MTWLSNNWPYLLIGYALISGGTIGGWIALCHIVWWREQRRSTSASRPGGRPGRTGSASARLTYQVRPRDEGTAPDDRAAVPVPGEKHHLSFH